MNDRPHILLDDDLEKLSGLISQLGGLVEKQIADTIDALSKRDTRLAEQVIQKDNDVNQLHVEIETAAATALTLRQPVSRDLRAIVAAIKISTNLERIGDLAKNIAKRAIVLNQEPQVKLIAGLVRMGRLVLAQVKQVLDAHAGSSVDQALEVWRKDDEIDELYNSLLREFLTYMMEDPRTIGLCTHLLFIAKNIERVGDHATNIAEVVYHVETAKYLSEDRPKGEPTMLTDVTVDQTPN